MATTTTGKTMLSSMQRLTKGGDWSMITTSDESVMMDQVMKTHSPDGREFHMRLLLSNVERILQAATLTVDTIIPPTEPENVALNEMLDILFPMIDWISSELSAKALTGGEAHGTTIAILNMLAPYSWETKVVVTLAAFAFNYGKFCLLAQSYSSNQLATNQLAKQIAILTQLPTIMEHSKELKPLFDTLDTLIQAMREVTTSVLDITELPSAYLSHELPAVSAALAHVPMAVYWTIKTAVACASQITNLTSYGLEMEISPTDAWELSVLTKNLKTTAEQLQDRIDICNREGEDKLHQILLDLFEANRTDNMKILNTLIRPKEDFQELVEGTTGKKVNIESLWARNVLLLISGLDISTEELSILKQIHSECQGHLTWHGPQQYEMVWIPVVDGELAQSIIEQFEALQSRMPWCTVDPRLVEKGVIRFIKEKWHFRNKPILVVLDPLGKVACPNAIHMIWIWRRQAFPFTTLREEALWMQETWTLDFLVNDIDQTILDWIGEGKYIFLYGGDNIEWIRKFTVAARQVAQAARIPLEMVYVGKSSKREQVRSAIVAINKEKLSYSWQDLSTVRLFWTRLESMLFSKIQLGKADENSPAMQQIKRLLSFDKAEGWAMLSRGSSITMNGHGTTVLLALSEYDRWKKNVATKGYDVAFKEHHDKIQHSMHLCCRLEFQSTLGKIPEVMRCPECPSLMEELITFFCCHDEDVPSTSE